MQELYAENYTMLMKEIKDLKEITCSRNGTLSVTKISISPKLIHRFNIIPIKISARFFVDVEKLLPKFT